MARADLGRIGSNVSLETLQAQIDRLRSIINGKIGFGDPNFPANPTIDILAGNPPIVGFEVLAHNGSLDNIQGSWVEVILTSTAAVHTKVIHHNLYLNDPDYVVPVLDAATGRHQPNCRWFIMGVMHDGLSTDATTSIRADAAYVGGAGLVTPNTISLKFGLVLVGNAPAINVFHPVRVTMFFIKATRGE